MQDSDEQINSEESRALATSLALGIESLELAMEQEIKEWVPDFPPLTVLLGTMASQFAKGSPTNEEAELVFERVEALLSMTSESSTTAVATGFVGGLVHAADWHEESSWLIVKLGPSAREYVRYYDELHGVDREI